MSWLEDAYAASKPLQNALQKPDESAQSQFDLHKEELAATLQDYPHLISLINRLRGTREGELLLQAAILLRVKAGDTKRKSSPFLAYRHSLRIAEANLKITEDLYDDKYLAQLAIKGLLHDLIEDFDKEDGKRNLRAIFSNEIALSIMKMTMPSRYILAKMYPQIVRQYVPAEDMKRQSPYTYLMKLRKRNIADFTKLSSALKLQFKCDRAQTFDALDEILTKGVDNPDALRSDSNDIEAGAIKIYANDNVGAEPREKESNIVYLSSAAAKRKWAERTTYHEVIMRRMEAIIRIALTHSTATEHSNLQRIKERLDIEFKETRRTFELHVNEAVEKSNFLDAANGILVPFPSGKRPAPPEQDIPRRSARL